MNEHPRQYKVTRRTPGADWSSWAHSYHRTMEQAEAAAARFFAGQGNYGIMEARRLAQSYVEVAERQETGRLAWYSTIGTIRP